jgi:hypothetical protein
MDTAETIDTRLAAMGRREILALIRTIDFFEFAGLWNHAIAQAWRTAARFRVAELSVPPAEA